MILGVDLLLPLSGKFSFQPKTWESREQGSIRLSLKTGRGGTLTSTFERGEGSSQPKRSLSFVVSRDP